MRYWLVGLVLAFISVLVLLSFFKGAQFFIFGFVLPPLFLLVLAGFAYYAMMFLFFLDAREHFKSRIEITQLGMLHLLNSVFLLSIQEYSLALLLQFVFPIWFLRRPAGFVLGSFLFFEHLVLLQLFAAQSYWLYFTILGTSTILLWMHKKYLFTTPFFSYAFTVFLLSLLSFVGEELLFDIYVWSDLSDGGFSLDRNIFYALTLLHIGVVLLLKRKRQSRFKQN